MYEKILQALKKARGKNSQITDRTLEESATQTAKYLTTDEQLALFDAKAVVATIEGNINHTMKTQDEKRKAEQEAEIAKKAKEEEDAKVEAERKKALEDNKDISPEVKAIMEQNRLLTESMEKMSNNIQSLQNDKVVTSRKAQLDKVLGTLPEIFTAPIKVSFESTTFENDEKFNSYLETIKVTKDTFTQKAEKDGINITTPLPNVKKPEGLEGQTKELSGALKLVEKKKLENAKNN